MNRIVGVVVMIILFFGRTRELRAQEAKVAIEVEEGYINDVIGIHFRSCIMQKILTSSKFRLSFGGEERIRLIVNTLPMYSNERTIATIYSIVWVLADKGDNMNIYLDTTLGYFGLDVASEVADIVVARTDRLLTSLVKR